MAEGKKHITRNRVSYSCQRCRQRKVKCNKVHPVCGSCQKTNEDCVYTFNEQDEPINQDTSIVDGGPAKKRKQPTIDSQRESSEGGDTPDGAAGLEDQLLRLGILLNQLGNSAGTRGDNPHTASDLKTPRTGYNSILTPGLQRSRGGDIAAQVDSSVNGESAASALARNNGESHGVPSVNAISAQLEQLTELLRTHRTDLVGTEREARDQSDTNGTFMQPKVAVVEGGLMVPTEQQRNALFRSWLSSVYPVLPIVDPALVLIHYRTFHFWYLHGLEKGVPNPSEEFVPLIFAIYYAGIASMSVRGIRKWFPGAQREQMLERVRRQYLSTLEVPAKLLTNPATQAAKVTMYYMFSQHNDDIGLTNASVPLVNAAYSCNLHRERPNETLEQSAVEVRRRLWWETVNLDTLQATASNMPPVINFDYCDTLMFREMKDSKLGTTEASQYESAIEGERAPDSADDISNNERSSMISVFYLVMKARTILGSCTRELLNVNLTTRPKTKEDMFEMRQSLTEIDRYIISAIARIPAKGLPEMNFTPATRSTGQSPALDYGNFYGENLVSCEIEAICGSTIESEAWEIPHIQVYRNSLTAFHKWARIVLSMLVDQTYCLSYAPFLSNSKRKLWISARQCGLRHAHSCLRKFNALATDIELERFRWTWPSFFQPIHACTIILLDTYERPNSREACRSRTLFDQMLSLSSPSYGIVGGEDCLTKARPLQESGDEAFNMLVQLRAKAWHKAGLDPSLLWTDQDQIDVGVATVPTDTEKLAQNFREDTVIEGTRGDHNTPTLLRKIAEGRATERFHPSVLGPPEIDGSTPTTHVALAESIPFQGQNGRRFLRARADQQQIPSIFVTTQSTQQNQPGHSYPFKPPSELHDVGELVKKIKRYQQSNQAQQTEDSEALSQQIATANDNLTSFPATNFLDNSNQNTAATIERDNNAATDQARTRNGLHRSHSPPSSQSIQTTNLDSQSPTPNIPAPAPETVTDMINMDFDWAKWDDIFGHILDDSFDDVGLDADADS